MKILRYCRSGWRCGKTWFRQGLWVSCTTGQLKLLDADGKANDPKCDMSDFKYVGDVVYKDASVREKIIHAFHCKYGEEWKERAYGQRNGG